MSNLEFEREFFSLAGIMFLCLYHELHIEGDKVFNVIGYMDYSAEMGIICQQRKDAISTRSS